jgi:hypothetical protein
MIIIAHDVIEKNSKRSSTNLTIGPACMIMLNMSIFEEFMLKLRGL